VGADAAAGGPFGPVRRAVRPPAAERYVRETPVTTAPAQRFVATASAAGGLAILAPGFFEYEHDAAGDLTVTLLRSVGHLSREDLPTRPGNAGWPVPTPEAQCLGRHRIQLALSPVGPDEIDQGAPLAELWEDTFLAPRAIWLRQATDLDPAPVDLRLEGEGLVFSALKPAAEGEGIVLRCYNAGDAPTEGRVDFGSPVAAVSRTRADERAPEPLVLERDGSAVRFTAGAREIVTLLVIPAERHPG
jgi:alpha-mannosidase